MRAIIKKITAVLLASQLILGTGGNLGVQLNSNLTIAQADTVSDSSNTVGEEAIYRYGADSLSAPEIMFLNENSASNSATIRIFNHCNGSVKLQLKNRQMNIGDFADTIELVGKTVNGDQVVYIDINGNTYSSVPSGYIEREIPSINSSGNIEIEIVWLPYQDVYVDNIIDSSNAPENLAPSPVYNIHIQRDENKKKILISWAGGLDAVSGEKITASSVDTNGNTLVSNELTFKYGYNESTSFVLAVYKEDGTNISSYITNGLLTSAGNRITASNDQFIIQGANRVYIDVMDLPYKGSVGIKSYDGELYSAETIYSPGEDISLWYTGYAVDDIVYGTEGAEGLYVLDSAGNKVNKSISSLVENDKLDTWYDEEKSNSNDGVTIGNLSVVRADRYTDNGWETSNVYLDEVNSEIDLSNSSIKFGTNVTNGYKTKVYLNYEMKPSRNDIGDARDILRLIRQGPTQYTQGTEGIVLTSGITSVVKEYDHYETLSGEVIPNSTNYKYIKSVAYTDIASVSSDEPNRSNVIADSAGNKFKGISVYERPLIGTVVVEIEPKNTAPVAHADIFKDNWMFNETAGVDVNTLNLNNISYNVETGIDIVEGDMISIPLSYLLMNDTDREINTNANDTVLVVSDHYIETNESAYPRCHTDCIGYADREDGMLKIQFNKPGEHFIWYKCGEEYSENIGLNSNYAKIIFSVREKEKVPELSAKTAHLTVGSESSTCLMDNITYNGMSDLIATVEGISFRPYGSSEWVKLANNIAQATVLSEVSDKIEYSKENNIKWPSITLQLNQSTYNGTEWSVGDEFMLDYSIITSGTGLKSSGQMIFEVVAPENANSNEGYLYVHRKPTALFSVDIDIGSDDYISKAQLTGEESYDIDHSISHKGLTGPDYSYDGLRAWEWTLLNVDTGVKKTYIGYNSRFLMDDGVTIKDIAGIAWGADTADESVKDTISGLLKEHYDVEYDDLINWQNGWGPLFNNDYALIKVSNNTTIIVGCSEDARDRLFSSMSSEISKLKDAGNRECSYILSLRVQDIDGPNAVGVWSDPYAISITTNKVPPVASFELDSSKYIVGKSDNGDGTYTYTSPIELTDKSYDPNGDVLKKWNLELTLPDGTVVSNVVTNTSTQDVDKSSEISTWVNTEIANAFKNYVENSIEPVSAEYSLSMSVEDATAMASSKVTKKFNVYLENLAPTIIGNPLVAKVDAMKFYEYDVYDGLGAADTQGSLETLFDGTNGIFMMADDQPLENLSLTYIIQGQRVLTRNYFDETRPFHFEKEYTGILYNYSPFSGTMSDNGYSEGVYKITVQAKDSPTGMLYEEGEYKVSELSTYNAKAAYHLVVVPTIDIYAYAIRGNYLYNCDGYIVDRNGNYNDTSGSYIITDDDERQNAAASIGDTIKIYCKTNDVVKSVEIELPDGTKANMTQLSGLDENGLATWEYDYTIVDATTGSVGGLEYDSIEFTACTEWGAKTRGEITRTKSRTLGIPILPVSLQDFRVTEVSDAEIKDTFNYYKNNSMNSVTMETGDSFDGYPIGTLALDGRFLNGSYIRQGYSFNFKLNSKGLEDEGSIKIKPYFYSANISSSGVTSIGNELHGYLPSEDGSYKRYTGDNFDSEINNLYKLYYEGEKINSLGNHNELILPRSLMTASGNVQTWSARYGIPLDAKFSTSGTGLTSVYEGPILVVFKISAIKDGNERYNYVGKGQWKKEREKLDTSSIYYTKENTTDWKNKQIGAVVVYNGQAVVENNFLVKPVWRE